MRSYNIYLLFPKDPLHKFWFPTKPNTVNEIVVYACSEKQARTLAKTVHGSEGAKAWDKEYSHCVLFSNKPRVVYANSIN